MVMGAVVLGAAVPALRAAAQLVDPRASDQLVTATSEQLLTTTDQLVTATGEQLLTTADQLVTGTTTDLTGLLIDSACYLSRGARATADHTACAIACAQKGGRLALLTPFGGVYMVIGVLTQNNNANLIPFVNKTVVLTGTAGTRLQDISTLTKTATTLDTRRLSTSQTEVVEKVTFRVGDFREGDIPLGSEQTFDAISAKLPAPPGK
jgi:hypothetical protein